MATTTTTRRRRRRSDAILASAVAAFRRQGFHGTSMHDIAEALELTKGSLYYYFDSKAAILAAAHDRALDRMLAVLGRVESAGLDPAAQLGELVVEHTRAMVDGFHGTALALELDALPPAARHRIVDKRDRYEQGLRRILERGAAAGVFRPVDSRLAGFALLGAINWMARWYRPEAGVDADAVGRAFADLFLRGVLEPRSPAAAAS